MSMLSLTPCNHMMPMASYKPFLPVRAKLYARLPRVAHRSRNNTLVRRTSGDLSESVATEIANNSKSHATVNPGGTEPAASNSDDEARQIVDEVLEAIKDTDSGLQASPELRARVDSLLLRLETLGSAQQPRPLDNPLLWGNYNVAYSSVGKKQTEGEPAGGRFRGRIGRALFRTTGLFQSVLKPDIATNKIEFRLFGFLPGSVGLRGRVRPEGENGDTVQVVFEPPVLSIANNLHLKLGNPSIVGLTTTYLDERIRLGKGRRGSLFVFTRGGAADAAGMDQVGLQRTSPTAAAAFSAFFLSLILGAAALWVSGQLVMKAVAVAMWLLGAAMGTVLYRGGIVRYAEDERILAEIERLRKEEEQRRERADGTEGGRPAAAASATA
ncbi:hypothetical protein Vretimale_3563 [Volvox reticuliferus]|uniref:Plastid lipid-associated protein/fibrillin conserved domain-containing protein n=1 Tax=Volvox reticuliferus TaxID=1737510 RepID=A0A8J4D982_9CHLO|nr:hypothetical protein Vretifemale_1144 [Volvox reticuliferus]GIL98158.1 hypothetical protein Vretimale_3563 [Volvox reticuliferus]